MSFNRRIYDDCATTINLSQSKLPGNYMLYDGKFYNENQCRIPKGIVGGNEVSLSKKNLVDLESDLRGQTRKLSDCPSEKYQPRISRCLKHSAGLPCGCTECQEELQDKTECKMFDYNDTALPEGIPQYKCNYPY
jgi:hypothetical protein